ncbi:M28 family peptidase [Rubrivirga sp.]|uniref:M28 family peptidase n=1 Tax=Rubrivirga sp. TaxID=1885344 RepID=UPI003B52D8C7
MRLLSVAAATLLALAAPSQAQTPTALSDPDLVGRYQATITPAELAGHLYVYADDYLRGRETGQPGQRFAARYLAGAYATMGVPARGTGTAAGPYALDGYLQPFALEQKTLRRLAARVEQSGTPVVSSVLEAGATDAQLVPAYGEVSDATPARLVHAGDGTDLSGLDLDDAYVVMTPGANQGATRAALSAVQAAGGRAAILATAPDAAGLAGQAQSALGAGRLALPALDTDDDAETGGLPPILFTSREMLDRLVAAADIDIEADGAPALGDTGLTLAVEAEYETAEVMSENVVAFIEGSDPVLKDEFVVVSAHLDHVGDHGTGEDAIYNGADDDGSGTVTILEIAEAFQRAKEDGHGPRRSVLFLHVSGEEKGLLGSEYYADRQPLVPMENTVANLNIDMIGRYDPERGFETTDYVYIIGGDLISRDISDWNAAVNETTGQGLLLSDRFNSPDDPNQFFRRSDHWNFGKHDVPFIFYFTGTHEDYHGVGDSADKIDYDRMARIGRLIFGTAWELANRDERPAVSGLGFN